MNEVVVDEEMTVAKPTMKEGEAVIILVGGLKPNRTGFYTKCREVGTGAPGILNIVGSDTENIEKAELKMDNPLMAIRVRCINTEGVCFLRSK